MNAVEITVSFYEYEYGITKDLIQIALMNSEFLI